MAKEARTTTRQTTKAKSRNSQDQASPDCNIATVGRAFDLLEALARVGPAPLATLAEAAGCNRSTGSDLLRTLQARGFVMQDEGRGLWRLGARWNVLGRAAAEQGALAATAMPFLVELGKATGENVYLVVRDGMESETIAIYQTDPTLRLYSEIGQRRSLHAGLSRMLLAHAPEAVQTQVLAQRLPRFTPATRTDPAWIAADLHRIRMRGYLVTSDEVVAGAVSVSAPVRDTSGQVVAVLFLSAPSMRMRPPRPRALVAQVFDAADRMSQVLGASPAAPPSMPATARQSQPSWTKTAVAPAGAGLRGTPPVTRPSAATAPHSMLR